MGVFHASESLYDFLFLDASRQQVADEIVQLRHESNIALFQNRVDLSGLDWNRSDRGSVHLGMRTRDRRELAATLRLTFFTSKSRLDETTLVPYPGAFEEPVALLSRAATDPAHDNQGLHSVLRCRALEVCLQTKTSVVLGSLEASANRRRALEDLGYEVLATQNDWGPQSYMRPAGPVLLVGLKDQSRLQKAVEILRHKYGLKPLTDRIPAFVWI